MRRLFSMKDEKSQFYAQIELSNDFLKFLDKIFYLLYGENWMIDDHYGGKLRDNDYFCFEKNEVYSLILITGERANVIIIGLSDNKEVKEFLFNNYSFKE